MGPGAMRLGATGLEVMGPGNMGLGASGLEGKGTGGYRAGGYGTGGCGTRGYGTGASMGSRSRGLGAAGGATPSPGVPAGRGGETVRSICLSSGAKVQCERRSEACTAPTRLIRLSGTRSEVAAAKVSGDRGAGAAPGGARARPPPNRPRPCPRRS